MSTTSAVAEAETLEYRLPRTVIPVRYQITLSPDLEKFKFDGEVTIEVEVKEPVTEVLLNALELEVHSAKAGNQEATIALLPENERLKLTFKDSLKPGKQSIFIKFTGALNDKLRGFYRSTYKDAQGNPKVMAVTQFEATDARRAFPCFDEPDFKAVYQSTLIVDEHLTALSNASVASEKKLGNGKKQVEFKDTMKMSTYLVAYVVGELVGTEVAMAGKTPVRVWCSPGKEKLTPFAVGIGVHSLNFFEKYYNVPYAGDKLDMIAIPDFAFGAMENLGCVTYRETALLVDQENASHTELERIADVVAHEIAHMWFGDLTTMSWWNGIWLNEAFATFAEMLAVDAFKPEWQRWSTFGVSRAAAFLTDSLVATRPIEFPVRHPHECEAMFDVLTYEKGASVLRMLEQFLDQDAFRKGVSYYLNKHQFANTETGDLWDAIEHESKAPVRAMMDSWIFQKGHPVISVSLEGTKLKLSQERFYFLPDKTREKQLFHVPVIIEVARGDKREQKKVLLTEESTTVDLGSAADYVVVNAGGHGFYRVRYSSELLQKVTNGVFEKLNGTERFNLVNDTWAMVVAGYTDAADYLKMLPMFQHETDKNVWYVIAQSLSYLERVIDESDRPALAAFTQKLIGPAVEKLGWKPAANEDQLLRQLRATLIGSLGTVGQCKATRDKAKEMFEDYKKDQASVDPNLLPSIVGILATVGDRARYDEFVTAWQTAKTPQDEERYLFALASFRDKELLKETLSKATSGDVRTQNAPYLLRSVMANIVGGKLAWEHMKENWKWINEKYPNNSIPRMMEGMTSLICPEMAKEVDEFLKKNPIPQGGKTIEQHRERLHVAIKFKEREGKRVLPALK